MKIGNATINICNVEYVLKIHDRVTMDGTGYTTRSVYDGWEVKFISGNSLYYPNTPEIAKEIERLMISINNKG